MRSNSGVAKEAPDGLGAVLHSNIQKLEQRREAEEEAASFQEKLAERVTDFAGSMAFVYLHLALLAAWILINVGAVSSVAPFDPSFVILATAASVEAIFLSTFVLISQNRAAAHAERRARLDLHVNLLSEREITMLVTMVRAIGAKLEVRALDQPEVREAERRIAPEKVLDRLEE